MTNSTTIFINSNFMSLMNQLNWNYVSKYSQKKEVGKYNIKEGKLLNCSLRKIKGTFGANKVLATWVMVCGLLSPANSDTFFGEHFCLCPCPSSSDISLESLWSSNSSIEHKNILWCFGLDICMSRPHNKWPNMKKRQIKASYLWLSPFKNMTWKESCMFMRITVDCTCT